MPPSTARPFVPTMLVLCSAFFIVVAVMTTGERDSALRPGSRLKAPGYIGLSQGHSEASGNQGRGGANGSGPKRDRWTDRR